MIKWCIQKLLYPIAHHLSGLSGRMEYVNWYRKAIYQALPDNLEVQKKKLFDIVQHTINTVPYYQNMKHLHDIEWNMNNIDTQIKEFPILTKKIIRNEFDNLISNKSGEKIRKNTSGGSTGEPVLFLQDHRFHIEEGTLCLDGLTGYELGDKVVVLWGSERDIIQGNYSLKSRLLSKFYYRKLVLNSFRMTNQDMLNYVQKINRFRAKYMVSYVQSAYELACFIERNELYIHSFQAIIVSAGTLYEDFRKKIEKVFQCKVYNRYGSREVGNMAMECSEHNRMHLNIFCQYLEFVDDEGQPVKKGEPGRILVTSLTNYTMPLIRFEIGDIGVAGRGKCSCGLGLPLIDEVKGRTVNVFKTKDGARIDGEYFTRLFYNLSFVKRLQIIQKDYEYIVIKIETLKEDDYTENKHIFDDMTQKIKLVMGESCHVDYEIVDEILPTPSGKFVYTISNL